MPFARYKGRAFECEGVAAALEKGGYVSEEFFASEGTVKIVTVTEGNTSVCGRGIIRIWFYIPTNPLWARKCKKSRNALSCFLMHIFYCENKALYRLRPLADLNRRDRLHHRSETKSCV
jgi:hypothetical protein